MILIKHELKQAKLSFWIWTISIASLLAICIFLFPQMENQMEEVNDIFSSMGSFSEAFGMDQLNFGTLVGFYSVECGNILGLGGAFFAAFCASSMLSKEERDRTAEFLMTHPVCRVRIISEKMIAVFFQITAMNLIVYAVSVSSVFLIGDTIPWKEFNLMHLAFYMLQLEIGGICFGISAFLKRGSIGIGLGVAILFYFMNLIANITEKAEILKYVTPYAYCEGADIVSEGTLNITYILIGAVLALMGVIVAYMKYTQKDIQS